MTMKEFAEMLSGREYGMEITKAEERQAADAGLLVLYGYSDDNVEIAGAYNDEVGAYNSATVHLTKTGVLQEPDCGQEDCPYYATARDATKSVQAVWHDKGGPCWTFETDIPHETFNIYEDGDLFCVGIVLSVEDL